MQETSEKKMTLGEALVIVRHYKQNIDTALEIGHGTAASAKFSEALEVVIGKIDDLTEFVNANLKF